MPFGGDNRRLGEDAGGIGSVRWIDPWDATRDDRVDVRCATLAAQPWYWLFFWLLLLIASLIWSAVPAYSQSAPPKPPEPEPTGHRIKVVLKSDTRELAHDYLELLDQARALAEDYSRYYADFHQARAEQLEAQLREFYRQLNDSAYISDYKQLDLDLAGLRKELKLQEQELAAAKGESSGEQQSGQLSEAREDRKLRQITVSLRRQLDILDRQLKDDIGSRLADNSARSTLVQQYVKAAVAAARLQKAAGEKHSLVGIGRGSEDEPLVIEVDLDMLQKMTDALEAVNLQDVAVVSAPDFPAPLPRIPDFTIVAPPKDSEEPPAEVGEKKIVYHDKSGESALTLEIVDSTEVNPGVTPVYIVNPFGSLEVQGWDRNWIMVSAEIEVVAKQPEQAEALADRVSVRMHNKVNAVYVETILPQLSDPQSRVERAEITIKAPADNLLSCRNSHGKLYVTGFDNDVKLNGNHCDVNVRDVKGAVEIVNSMGRLQVSDVTGRLELRNAYEQLEVSRCNGPMIVENSFAPIELTECSGDVKIRNSGTIDVTDHTGEVDIQNNNGIVTVRNLDGSIRAANSLHPVVIENVSGSAGLENLRGAIEVSQIYGPVSASNVHGSITASDLSGPLQLVSSNGVVDVDIERAMTGRSSITADFGTVRLKMAERSDLLLTVQTFGGAIQSGFSPPVDQTDSSSTTRIELGRLLGSLDVSGRSSDIVISQAR